MTYNRLKSSGKIMLSLLFLFPLIIQALTGQNLTSRVNSLAPYSVIKSEIPPVEGTLNIIAVMVEFIPDDNRFTSGNGTFAPGSIPYLENPGTNIDALPHNRQYFEAHLEFVKNYFKNQSRGLLQIQYQVLPGIYRLDKEMAEYSPIGENPDLSSLGLLVNDVWNLVANDGNLSINLNRFENTAFIIFHAGVGRDIELTGTTLDKTPQDIPSVYLGTHALRNVLDDAAFTGFEIDNGNLLVTNTLILPRTLSRSGEDFSGERFVLPLSTNGMITAQIASHLGLPDLFNTETGESGIGRFGLMDGAGIFSFNGLFPPGLSAWEKIYLGWAEPFDVSYNEPEPVTLAASSFNQQKSIARISLSVNEYFLVENRHRDTQNEGVTLTIRRPDGSLATQNFNNRDEDFINRSTGFDDLLEPGVVINVNNFDFSLPGGFDPGSDTTAERDLNGGILIWHIDESVIQKKMGQTGINNNPDRRAVNLQEADGAQDIGRPAAIGLFQNEVNGSAFDFWWSGNNATVITQTDSLVLYQNRFGPDTTPNNNSNSGAPSYFEMFDFSGNLPFASFRIRDVNPFSNLYTLIEGRSDLNISSYTDFDDPYSSRYPLAMQPIIAGNKTLLMIPGNNGIQFYNTVDQTLFDFDVSTASLQQPFTGFENPFITIAENPLQNTGKLAVEVFTVSEDGLSEIWNFETDSNSGFISSAQNFILDFDGTTFQADLQHLELIESANAFRQSEMHRGYQSRIEENQLIITSPGGSVTHPISPNPRDFSRVHTGIIDNPGREILFYLLLDGKLLLFTEKDNFSENIVITDQNFIDWPAIADFNRDGNPDFLFTNADGVLTAKNRNGAVLKNFPVSTPSGVRFTGTPLIADLNGDGSPEILVSGQDEYSVNIYAYDSTGEAIEGFPLHVGAVSDQKNQPVHPVIFENNLAAVSHAGDLKIWEFPSLEQTDWASRYGNSTNNKVSAFLNVGSPLPADFNLLNTDETYNWPNPAFDETYIRFQTSTQAEISLKITTMSGRLIFNHQFQSRGLSPEEIRIDTSHWASGGYFALLEASNGSTTERKLIKIAVIK